jgi:hypothetical protein
MAGHKHANVVWGLIEKGKGPGGSSYGYGTIHSALLMDIRDELQKLNALLSCRNFVAIPSTLERIARNTVKRKRTKHGNRR